MSLFLQSLIVCVIFTLIIVPSVYKNPSAHIMSYPVEIRNRVESLPQYKDIIVKKETNHKTAKVLSCFVFAGILSLFAYWAGARTFKAAFIHVFLLFFIGNIYDLIVLDLLIFCNCKWSRIPGTEDMDEAYHNPRHHIIGAVKGIGIGVVVALMAGGIVGAVCVL